MIHNDITVPLEDIYIDKASPKIAKIPCFLLAERDFLEYSMGFRRGEMDALLETEKSFNITLHEDVCESLSKHDWGIIPSEDELTRIVDFFWSNYERGVKNRVWYTKEFPTQSSYTYRLLFNEEHVLLHLPDGQPCISEQTLVTTPLHPLLAVVLAADFVVFNQPPNLDSPGTIHDTIVSLATVMARPLWLSWFENPPRLTTPLRPQPKAVRDLAKHL